MVQTPVATSAPQSSVPYNFVQLRYNKTYHVAYKGLYAALLAHTKNPVVLIAMSLISNILRGLALICYFILTFALYFFTAYSLQFKVMSFSFDPRQILSVTMILFAIIDILGAVPVIIEMRQRVGHIESEKASVAVLVLMVVFLFLGEELLKVIGLDVASFAIAGSLVIFIIAMEMILGIKFFKEEVSNTVSIVPLAFPLIAGAGTMTTLLSLKSQYQTQNIIVGIILNTMFVYLVLKNVHLFEKLLGKTGINILRKAFGIILLAIAIKLFRSNTHL